MPMMDRAKLPSATVQSSHSQSSPNERLTTRYFSLCGERPEALPLDTATFCKRWTKTFVWHQRAKPEASDLRESEVLKFILNRLRELRAGSACSAY